MRHRAGRAGPVLCAAPQALCLAGCAAPRAGDSALQRQTAWGPVLGSDDAAARGTWSWKGVPYAQAPVGDLRWRAPRDPVPWSIPRSAHVFAPACVQTQRLYGRGLNNRYDETMGSALDRTAGAEDCLYLNIWTPASRPAAPRPAPSPGNCWTAGRARRCSSMNSSCAPRPRATSWSRVAS